MLRSLWRRFAADRVRASRRPSRGSARSRPALEGLEDRMVLSTVNQFGSTLNIVASPGTATAARTIQLEADALNPAKLDVKDNGTLLGQFTIASINKINVQVAGDDVISANDSNGFPFAPGTNVSLFGGGANRLAVVGSRAVGGLESFVAGTSTLPGSLSLAPSLSVADTTFHFTGAVPRVSDEVANASPLLVQTNGTKVDLTGANGVFETLSGLAGAGGGGDVLSFEGKASVGVNVLASNATATLNATAAAKGLQFLQVKLEGTGSTADINAAPAIPGSPPNGGTAVIGAGLQDQVNLRANAGPVTVIGGQTTKVILGSNDTNFDASVTSGIRALVQVRNVGVLDIADGGNVTTKENVTVTESSITGTGLFGPGGSVQYSFSSEPGLLVPAIFTGRLANTYTVTTSSPGATFNSRGDAILIEDDSTTGGLSVTVDVNGNTDLSLSLVSKSPAASSLFIAAPPGSAYLPFVMPTPEGFEQVDAPGAAHATSIFYNGFDTAHHS